MRTSPQAFLDVARVADAVLFWPALAFIVWGELKPDVPTVLQGINDKVLHFGAYFILGAMAGGAIRRRSWLKWAALGLIVVGAIIEFIQAFVGRDPSLLDGITNGAGVIAGVLVARFILELCTRAVGLPQDTPREATRC
jgi:VanZ family protein